MKKVYINPNIRCVSLGADEALMVASPTLSDKNADNELESLSREVPVGYDVWDDEEE
jgi:hypothetical protein